MSAGGARAAERGPFGVERTLEWDAPRRMFLKGIYFFLFLYMYEHTVFRLPVRGNIAARFWRQNWSGVGGLGMAQSAPSVIRRSLIQSCARVIGRGGRVIHYCYRLQLRAYTRMT